jgi:hypothetical protein
LKLDLLIVYLLSETIAVWGRGSKGVCGNYSWRGSWGRRLAMCF